MSTLKASPQKLRNIVEHLSLKIGPRPYSRKEALLKAKEFIMDELSVHGRSILVQDYLVKGEQYSNILATGGPLDWDKLSKKKCLVVGAHYDTVSSTPGADDNASGIAGLIELSRILGKDLPGNVILSAFTLEEPPFYRTRRMGSYQVAKMLKAQGIRLHGMICLEMIGYFNDSPKSQHFPLPLMNKVYPDRGNFIGLVGNTWSKGFTRKVEEAFLKAGTIPTYSLNAPFIVFGIDLSDHWAFYKFGYCAVMVTDTAFYRNPNYHRPTDLPDTLDYKRMAGVVDALVEAVMELGS